jgi:Flp pilus assembly secretin CpaC
MHKTQQSPPVFLTVLGMLLVVPCLFAQVTTDSPVVPILPVPTVAEPVLSNPLMPQVERRRRVRPSVQAAELWRAAEHLTAAGKRKLANQLTREALLQEKLDQLHKFQAEIEQLRNQAASDKTVHLHVKIMEVQVTKMRKLGLDFEFESFTDSAAIKEFLAALQESKLVKVLAEPTLITVSGRPASFSSGGEFPVIVPQEQGGVAIEYRQFGTRLDCVAEILDSGRLRVELRPSVSEIDPSRSVTIQDRSVPGLRTHWVDTALEMEPGQTVFLSGLTQSLPEIAADETERNETAPLVAVTANLGAPVAQARKRGPSTRL